MKTGIVCNNPHQKSRRRRRKKKKTVGLPRSLKCYEPTIAIYWKKVLIWEAPLGVRSVGVWRWLHTVLVFFNSSKRKSKKFDSWKCHEKKLIFCSNFEVENQEKLLQWVVKKGANCESWKHFRVILTISPEHFTMDSEYSYCISWLEGLLQDKNEVQHHISVLLFVGLVAGFLMLLSTKLLGSVALTGTQLLHYCLVKWRIHYFHQFYGLLI